MTTSNLMFYLLHSYFASSQRLLNPLPLLMLDAYHLQVVWLARPLSYHPLDNTSNISFGFLVSLWWSDVVHWCIWCEDGVWDSLQVLCILDCCTWWMSITLARIAHPPIVSKPKQLFPAMASGHKLCLCHRQCDVWLNFCNSMKWLQHQQQKYVFSCRSLIVCIFCPIHIAKSSQGNILISKV